MENENINTYEKNNNEKTSSEKVSDRKASNKKHTNNKKYITNEEKCKKNNENNAQKSGSMKVNANAKKKSLINRIVNIIILIGVLVVTYPFVSQMYYRYVSSQNIHNFDSDVKNIEPEEVKRRIALASGYNDSLHSNNFSEPYKKENLEKGRMEYARMLEVHEKIGHISIPKINEDLPIYAGTSESVLQKGVGHMEGTSLPIGGKGTHSVLTAHSGIPNNRLFTDLNKIKKGDKFFITNIKQTLAYKVDNIRVVEPSNFSELVITEGKDYVTLLTCTPYMINTHRLLVRGHRIPYNEAEKKKELEKNGMDGLLKMAIVVVVFLFILTICLFGYKRKKKKKKRDQNIDG
ncbi:MAG: class C sortase [Peptostreptococcus porci]|nr:class C sortase [Peptostreptococcus porci]